MRQILTFIILVSILSGCTLHLPEENMRESVGSGNNVARTGEGSHLIVGGASEKQATNLTQLVQAAHEENAPLRKGRELEQQERWFEAIEHYKTLLAFPGVAWEAHRGLAASYEAIGDYGKAIEHLESSPPKDYARPEYESKISALKIKAISQSRSSVSAQESNQI